MDETLLAAACAGSSAAIEEVLTQLRPLVVRYCRARLGGRLYRMADADDCVQDVLLAVFAALPHYRPPADTFIGFVFGIAAHKVANTYHRRGTDRSGPFADIADWNITDPAASPSDHAERADNARQIRMLLAHLPDRAREVLVLRIAVGLSAQATADALGLPSAGAVRILQHRALTQLRALHHNQAGPANRATGSARTIGPARKVRADTVRTPCTANRAGRSTRRPNPVC